VGTGGITRTPTMAHFARCCRFMCAKASHLLRQKNDGNRVGRARHYLRPHPPLPTAGAVPHRAHHALPHFLLAKHSLIWLIPVWWATATRLAAGGERCAPCATPPWHDAAPTALRGRLPSHSCRLRTVPQAQSYGNSTASTRGWFLLCLRRVYQKHQRTNLIPPAACARWFYT